MLLLTVRAVIERFLAHAVSTGRYCPEALRERRRTLAEFAAHLGERPLIECCPDDLAEWIDAHPTWKATNTRRAKCQFVQTCFNWAKRVGRVTLNPFAGLVYEEGEPRGPTADGHLDLILEVANREFRRLLQFARATGCRPCELRRILWAEVDWQRGVIVHQKHKTRKKTKKPRLIPLTAEALAILQRVRLLGEEGHIFRNTKGGPWTKQALVLAWQRARKRARVPAEAKLVGIRHQTGTEAVRKGGDIKLVSLAMGHASVTTTERYYLHLDGAVEEMTRALEKGKR